MKLIKRVLVKLAYLYKVFVLRDPHFLNVRRWFKDFGCDTFNLDYPLNASSLVLDVGGYLGDYADAVSKKFGCRVILFEPIPSFYDACVTRFSGNSSIVCLNYGLSSVSGNFSISVSDNASSFKTQSTNDYVCLAEVRSFKEVICELGINDVDLVKINIEGGEYDLLPSMIESGLINQVRFLQIQFHNFVEGAVENRQRIRKLLEKTHRQMWNYEFVWESWERL